MRFFSGSIIFLTLILACTQPTRPERALVQLKSGDHGTVILSPFGESFEIGTAITCSAQPDSGFLFAGWHGTFQSMQNPFTFILAGDVNLTAQFVKVPQNSDLVSIHSQNVTFAIGDASLLSSSVDRPVHSVSFSYNFLISSREINQSSYMDVTGHNPAPAALKSDSFPVINVSWYDAVKYCNARSKREGYDTVYQYSAVCSDTSDCPYTFENLVIRYHVFGYRLPTEAEWEYACRAGSSSTFYWGDHALNVDTNAWHESNSMGQLHTSGLLKPNSFGLYDMSGNVAEWVNDWLSVYPKDLVVDPVGPRKLSESVYAATWERPVRGGSYRLGSSFLRSGCRRGPYATFAKIRQSDIGFRVALGAFYPNDSLYVPSLPPDSLKINYTASQSAILSALGTNSIKLAFVAYSQAGAKAYGIDFSKNSPNISPISDTERVAFISLSPNGQWVAFSSGDPGFNGASHITIRSLGAVSSSEPPVIFGSKSFMPRWWVDPGTHDTSIIFTDGASLDNEVLWSHEKTYKTSFNNGQLGQPQILWSKGSYHGGLSSDGRFLGTAYPVAKVVDLQLSDTNIFYFEPPYNGRVDAGQTCNFSMSPTHTDPGRAMFLDFGYSKVSSLIGRSYRFHEFIFEANTRLFANTNIVRWYGCPQGYIEWDDIQYSNHPDYGIAVARTGRDDDPNAIFLINFKDSVYTKILEGMDIRRPALWIDPQKLPEIPNPYALFGRYDLPIQTPAQINIDKKMKLFWKYRDSITCVALGSSPTADGIAPDAFTHEVVLNMAGSGAQSNLVTSLAIARQFVLTKAPNVKAFIFGLDPGFLNLNFKKVPPIYNGLYDSKGYELDVRNNFWVDSLPEQVALRIASWGTAQWSGFTERGYPIGSLDGGTGWGQPILDGSDYSIHDSCVQFAISDFERFCDTAELLRIAVILVNFPENPLYAQTVNESRYGPSRNTYASLSGIFRSIESSHPHMRFYDANKGGQHDFTDSEALDCNHLNHTGARRLSAQIDSILSTISF